MSNGNSISTQTTNNEKYQDATTKITMKAQTDKSAPEYPPATDPSQRSNSVNFNEGESDNVIEF
jgi:hypothetical protein